MTDLTKSKSKTAKKSIKQRKNISCWGIRLLQYFWNDIGTYSVDPVVKLYLVVLGLDPDKLMDETKEEFETESIKMVQSIVKYPCMLQEIINYLVTNENKLAFLQQNFSQEQIKYITNLDIMDTKLIACAGSGKTRSIIGRIKFLVEHGFVPKEEIFAITFSKPAAVDFHRKISELFPGFAEFCQIKNFSTIDSLAKSILCRVKSHKSDNVEILSIALRNYLRGITPAEIELVSKVKKIKHLFVDEAQDLNEVQYEAIMLFKEKFGTVIELIGDPNQNIFQFRRSSSIFLTNFGGKHYELTLNFRSTEQIINFSDQLKPIPTTKSVSATNKQGPPVTIMTKSTADIHRLIIQFINLYKKTKELSGVAFICPTRGIGSYDNIGLSVLFNFFKLSNIPFNQLYDESGLNDERKKDVSKKPGHVNILTYHGTKGLEFDVVFVMDFYQFLFNIKPTEMEHQTNRYLLYVASSRAVSMMFVCTYTNMHGGYLNHWITSVGPTNYLSDGSLRIPQLAFREEDSGPTIHGITELVSEMPEEMLDTVHDILCIEENETIFTRRIYQDFTQIDRGKDETLFGIFCEELFYLQYFLSIQQPPRKLGLIEMILASKFIIVDNEAEFKMLKTYITTNKLTWELYDTMKNLLPEKIIRLVNKYFTRDREINDCIVCTNEFVKIIEANLDDIKKTYQHYLNPVSYQYYYQGILFDFFYLIVVQYAYDINHYFYISQHGKEKEYLLENGRDLFEAMNIFICKNYLICDLEIKVSVCYPKMALIGEMDFIEMYPGSGTIVEIKCVKEISIRYYIQLILYNFCYAYQTKQFDKIFTNKFKIINLLTGLEHSIILRISPTNLFNLLVILAAIGNLKFSNMNLVYDLETTDMFRTVGPFNYKPTIPRAIVRQHQSQYFAEIYPEIVEIAIKDYETGMVLLNTLVKPRNRIVPTVEQLTGIKTESLIDKPDINTIREVLQKKMKNFINCKMMAHNGQSFDNKIVTYDKLVEPLKVSFLDTQSIIPIHLPLNDKLLSKKLETIYEHLFHKKFRAHRAMADVDALLKIMHHLKICF